MVFNASHEAPPPHLLIFGIMRNTMHAESWGLPIDADQEMVHQPHLNTTHSQTCPKHLRLIRSVGSMEHSACLAYTWISSSCSDVPLDQRYVISEVFLTVRAHRSMPCSLRHTCCGLLTSSSYRPFTLGDACLMALMSSFIVHVIIHRSFHAIFIRDRKMVSLHV